MSRRPLLGVVHPETGEILTCPACQHREDVIVQLEKENRLHKAKITKLERERDEEGYARNEPLWDEAECLHTWWRLSCWYPLTHFEAEDFWIVNKHLKRIGLVGCLQAVCGAAYDPYVSWQKNGKEKRHNGWKKIWESKDQMESFAERVPGEEGDQVLWRKWLIQRIESHLTV